MHEECKGYPIMFDFSTLLGIVKRLTLIVSAPNVNKSEQFTELDNKKNLFKKNIIQTWLPIGPIISHVHNNYNYTYPTRLLL